jgi:undecaprenyl-diphosphatase
MTLVQVILLALIQGVTELFPISSLGHAVIVPDLLNWRINQQADWFLPFLVVMHLGTAIALLAYFWRDWLDFGLAVLLGRGADPAAERRLFWRVVLATIPAVILGAALEKVLKTDALIIGLWQCLALIPGISRSGVTMVGGFRAGLDHNDAARFSFLTATPIILGATALEAPKLLKHARGAAAAAEPHGMLGLSLIAGVIAGLAAYASLWAIMRWFKRHEFKAFDPFAYYCLGAGLLFLIVELAA